MLSKMTMWPMWRAEQRQWWTRQLQSTGQRRPGRFLCLQI